MAKSSWVNTNISKKLMFGSLVSVVMSAIGYIGYDFWLASTQWLLVSAVMALLEFT